jgi:hypothetical protein
MLNTRILQYLSNKKPDISITSESKVMALRKMMFCRAAAILIAPTVYPTILKGRILRL